MRDPKFFLIEWLEEFSLIKKEKNLLYLLQALLNPLQKNPAMGPSVLAKRLIIVQCKRNGEGEPEREKEVTATMATMARI